MTEAWLHRRGKPTWHFMWIARHVGMCHTTRRGTVYKIACVYPYRCFEVLRLDYLYWVAVEKELRAHAIEFADGGVYAFPGKR
jgi:hypothetical protein